MIKVLLDAGHSEAPKSFSREDEIDLLVCREIREIIMSDPQNQNEIDSNAGIVAFISEQRGLMEKVYSANEKRVNFYVSIHCNWSDSNKAAKGFNIYYNEPITATDKTLAFQSRRFAELTARQMIKYGLNPFGTDAIVTDNLAGCGNLAVCSYTKMPAILIELCFLSNPEEAKIWENAELHKLMGHAILNAVRIYNVNA